MYMTWNSITGSDIEKVYDIIYICVIYGRDILSDTTILALSNLQTLSSFDFSHRFQLDLIFILHDICLPGKGHKLISKWQRQIVFLLYNVQSCKKRCKALVFLKKTIYRQYFQREIYIYQKSIVTDDVADEQIFHRFWQDY